MVKFDFEKDSQEKTTGSKSSIKVKHSARPSSFV